MVRLLLKNKADPTTSFNLEVEEVEIMSFAKEILRDERIIRIISKNLSV